MSRTNNPSIDPANNGTLAGSLRFAFHKLTQNMNGMLPARVITYDRTANRVSVQLLISMVTTDGTLVSRSQLASIPVLLLGGGGFMLNFNLNTGDLGWVLANDRDISIFLQTYEESEPNTARMFSFSDSLFIPDVMKDFTIDEEDESNFVIQNLDGSVKITFGTDTITVKAPNVNIETTSLIGTQITGNLFVIGDIEATGDITPNVPPP